MAARTTVSPPPGLAPPPGLEAPVATAVSAVSREDLAVLAARNVQLKKQVALMSQQLLVQQQIVAANMRQQCGASAVRPSWTGGDFVPGGSYNSATDFVPGASSWGAKLENENSCTRPRTRTESTATGSSSSPSDNEVDLTDEKTTVIMKELPTDLSRDGLVSLLEARNFSGKFDFIYIPHNFKLEKSFGYAFINFQDIDTAEAFVADFSGFADWGFESNKTAVVQWAETHQGLEAHVQRYRNSPTMHETVPDGFKPALYQEGQRVAFPAATKVVKAPRFRR